MTIQNKKLNKMQQSDSVQLYYKTLENINPTITNVRQLVFDKKDSYLLGLKVSDIFSRLPIKDPLNYTLDRSMLYAGNTSWNLQYDSNNISIVFYQIIFAVGFYKNGDKLYPYLSENHFNKNMSDFDLFLNNQSFIFTHYFKNAVIHNTASGISFFSGERIDHAGYINLHFREKPISFKEIHPASIMDIHQVLIPVIINGVIDPKISDYILNRFTELLKTDITLSEKLTKKLVDANNNFTLKVKKILAEKEEAEKDLEEFKKSHGNFTMEALNKQLNQLEELKNLDE